jgi:hypothetical protein
VWKWEHGTSRPEAATLIKVAKALGCSVDQLLLGVDDEYDASRAASVGDPSSEDNQVYNHDDLKKSSAAVTTVGTPASKHGAASRVADVVPGAEARRLAEQIAHARTVAYESAQRLLSLASELNAPRGTTQPARETTPRVRKRTRAVR